MKFGRDLPRNQVPEWSSAYVDYKRLKKLINQSVLRAPEGDTPDLAVLLHALDRNLDVVDVFYNQKLADSARRLEFLHRRYDFSPHSAPTLRLDERVEIWAVLTEDRARLRKLQFYGELNRRGFIKITKKLDKKIPHAHIQPAYIRTKLDPKPFATNEELSQLIVRIDDWLARLANIGGPEDDTRKLTAPSQTQSVCEKPLGDDEDFMEASTVAIHEDNVQKLQHLVSARTSRKDGDGTGGEQSLWLDLLQRSIAARARGCIDFILGESAGLEAQDGINDRNCLHRAVITCGQPRSADCDDDLALDGRVHGGRTISVVPAAAFVQNRPPGEGTELEATEGLKDEQEPKEILEYLLESLRPYQRRALIARDSFGRLPLHYAAQHGLVDVCQLLIRYMRRWDQYDATNGIDGEFWQDLEGWAPVHLSALAGHHMTTKVLLESEGRVGDESGETRSLRTVPTSNAVLRLVTKANHAKVLTLLLEADFDINAQDDQGETALHVAARFGHMECAKTLVEGTDTQRADLDLAEKIFAWTPLFVACVEGKLGIVQLLMASGAQSDRSDLSGWSAKEHAVLRGHLTIARCLNSSTFSSTTNSGNSTSISSSPLSTSFDDRRSQIQTDHEEGESGPSKTFGHRYLDRESLILVGLGTMDTRKTVHSVTLDRAPLALTRSIQPDTALSVVVSAIGASGEPSVVDLPVEESVCADPISFRTPDASKVQLRFDLVPTYSGSKERVIGRAVAMLSNIRPTIGSRRSPLQGDVSVPILAANTLEVIGSVNFNFLVITPFQHPNMSITKRPTYWKSVASTMLIGHRGLGKNQPARKSLQLGENTIQSFIAAANLGASYVEFDVQLTKDHVPVIYHDFLVSETGIDAPVHTLTLEQFLHVSHQQTIRPSRPPSPALSDSISIAANGRKQRSYSTNSSNIDSVGEMRERMRHTRDMKVKGYKGNSRGNFIQEPFTTLETMFKKLDESIGFNIEMKYPMLFESEEQGMDAYAVEPNSFVDSVLEIVYRLSGKRNIIFSSFNPDICLLLSFKQPSIPVLFLTDAGSEPACDVRAGSLQEAIRFASRWNLLGIVTSVEPLLLTPRLIRVVKGSGLVCVSYGTMNNIPENVELQVKEGIDAVIVDSVLAIRKGLTHA